MAQKIETKKASAKSTETSAAYSSETVTDSSDFININIGSSVTETTPKNTTAAGAAGAISQFAIEVEPEVASELMAEVEAPATEIFAEAPITQQAWGWFQRKLGEWIKCRVLEFVEGRYLLEAQSMVGAGMIQFRAYPEDLRWEAPIG
jgi:hypothetical protein